MKKQIWKFSLGEGSNTISMPKGAEILTVQTQQLIPVIWALVDPSAEKEERHFEVFATGENIHCDMGVERKYINTFQIADGVLIYHLFERIN